MNGKNPVKMAARGGEETHFTLCDNSGAHGPLPRRVLARSFQTACGRRSCAQCDERASLRRMGTTLLLPTLLYYGVIIVSVYVPLTSPKKLPAPSSNKVFAVPLFSPVPVAPTNRPVPPPNFDVILK